MSIENMTIVSHILLAASVLLAAAAVIMFFAMDVPKCWQMVSGMVHVRKRQLRVNRMHKLNGEKTEKINGLEFSEESDAAEGEYEPAEETLPLGDKIPPEYMAAEKTVLLQDRSGVEQTELLGIEELKLIQDIVYIQDEELEAPRNGC